MEKIYLDNSATTKLDSKVIEAMNKSYDYFGNPSSLHAFGQGARKLVDDSRDIIAEFLNCKPTEVIFTSGGSESDNLAIKGLVSGYQSPVLSNQKPHLITSAIEHHAVLHTVQDLEKEGKIEATYIEPNEKGLIALEDIQNAVKDNTVLISIMYVNNEVGTIQPIREIGKMVEKINAKRKLDPRIKSEDDKVGRIYFHTDAVQATEWMNMDIKHLHVDLLTLTAHKIHGPKGIGLLFAKKGTPISPQIVGGEQEFRLRAGTENVAGIVGLAEAIKLVASNQLSVISQVKFLRDKLENEILKNVPETYLNGDKAKRAPHILNISFKNAEGEAIILNLDFLGIAVSSGSACTARSLDPSHVLKAMKVPQELTHGAIRFSLSHETTSNDIDEVLKALPGIIKKLREMSPFR